MTDKQKRCDECKSNVRNYSDGFILKDWSGRFTGDPNTLPKEPDNSKFWTYQDCKKNSKKLFLLNLEGKCNYFEKK
jgi:hypothetical protein